MKIDLNQNMTARSTKVGLSTLATPSDSAPPVMTLDQLHFCSVGWRSNLLKQSTIRVILICSSISCTGGRHRPTYSLIKTGDWQFLMFDSSHTTPLVFYPVEMVCLVTMVSTVSLVKLTWLTRSTLISLAI